MIDESLLKSNFLGRDGFRWWIGQIPPAESMDQQINKEGWGNRTKVRILGYHPYDDGELPNEELPWAQILLSTTDGCGASNFGVNHKVRLGDIVFGFFLDGDNAQIPVISGVFGRTDQVPTTTYTSPFVPFTGYTDRIENDGSRVKINEQNGQTNTVQEAPVHLPPATANSINQIAYSSVIGDNVRIGSNVVISNSIIANNVNICDGSVVGKKGFGFKLYNDSEPENPLRSMALIHNKNNYLLTLYPYEYSLKVLNSEAEFEKLLERVKDNLNNLPNENDMFDKFMESLNKTSR